MEVSILVSVDSVLEVNEVAYSTTKLNVSILVSVDSVLEGSDRRDASPTRIWFQS